MRDLHDLMGLLTDLERCAPDQERVLGGLPRAAARRRHRRRAVVGVAAGLALVVAAVPIATQWRSQASRVEVAHRVKGDWTPFSYRVTLPGLTGYKMVTRSTGAAYESLLLAATTQRRGMLEHIRVSAFPAKDSDLARYRSGEQVTVHGKAGYYVARGARPPLPPHPPEPMPTVVWQYKPGTWVIVQAISYRGTGASAPTDERGTALRAAGTVRLAERRFIRLPFRLAGLPPSIRLTEVDSGPGGSPRAASATVLGQGGGKITLRVAVSGRGNITENGSERIRVAGRNAYYNPVTQALVIRFGAIAISVNPEQFLYHAREEVTTIAKAIIPATDPDDPGTWFSPSQFIAPS